MFKTGSLVWLRNSARECKKGDKLKPHWLGPYKVVECLGKGVLKIANAKTGKTLKKGVNQCRLKHYHGSHDSVSTQHSNSHSTEHSISLSDDHCGSLSADLNKTLDATQDESLEKFSPSSTSTPVKDLRSKVAIILRIQYVRDSHIRPIVTLCSGGTSIFA